MHEASYPQAAVWDCEKPEGKRIKQQRMYILKEMRLSHFFFEVL